MNAFVIDIESNELYPYSDIVWTIVVKKVGSDEFLLLNPFKEDDTKRKMMEFIFVESCPTIVVQNGLSFDLWMLWKMFDMEFQVEPSTFCGQPVVFFDTLYASQYLLPDRVGGHSLHSWGERYGDHKIEYRRLMIDVGMVSKSSPKGQEFREYHPIMDIYCKQDCAITERMFIDLNREISRQGNQNSFRIAQKSFYLMCAQAHTGFKFSRTEGEQLKVLIEQMIIDLREEVEPALPERRLKKSEEAFYTLPSKIYKKDGSLTSHMEGFIERHDAFLLSEDMILVYGKSYPIHPKLVLDVRRPMNLSDQNELKGYFLENGWKPTLWNVKKDSNGKPVRDVNRQLIRTTPKIQENGKICINLATLEAELPSKIVRFLSLRNRLGVLTGWLSNSRLDWDGRISGGSSGIASTHRQKHVTIVNTPKAEVGVLLGKEFRNLWTSDEGNTLIGCDAAALENRMEAHWVFKYDDGETATEILSGDPHCFSEDTEILTEDGWKTFDQITIDSKVCQWDENVITFVNPTEVIWEDYSGEMINISGKNLSMTVTPNHRIPVIASKDTSKVVDILAKDLVNNNSNHRIPSSGIYENCGINLSDSELKLIIVIQSDGYIQDGSVRFTFTENRKVERIREILYSSNLEWTESIQHRDGKDEKRLYVKKTKELRRLLAFIDEDKNLKDVFIELNKDQRDLFLNEIAEWNGTRSSNGDIIIDTTSEKLVNLIQTIAHLSGVTSSFYKKDNLGDCQLFRAYISLSTLSLLKQDVQRIEYKGKIGCVTVPSGYILVRKNGCVIVSGNSKNAKAFYPDETKDFDVDALDFNQDDPVFKPYRSKSKNGKYCVTYGGSAKKLATTLGQSEDRGTFLYDAFWTANPALKNLKDDIESFWINHTNKVWIPTIDGRRVYSRSQHSLVNLLFQSSGAILMDYAGVIFHDRMGGKFLIDQLWRPYYLYKGYIIKRVLYVHDEFIVECPLEIAEEIASIMEWCIERAGIVLKLSIPSVGKAKVGYTWKDTH